MAMRFQNGVVWFVVILGCACEPMSENIDLQAFEVVSEDDRRPPCAAPFWPYFNPIHRGAEVTVGWEQSLDLRVAIVQGKVNATPESGSSNPLIRLGFLGLYTIFTQTQGTECRPTVIRREVEVVEAYAGTPDELGSDAIPFDDTRIVAWSNDYLEPVEFGPDASDQWKTPGKALGPATMDENDVVSLGSGGKITLLFQNTIRDGEGPDLAIFSNGLRDGFSELALVSVSSDGEHFATFPHAYLGSRPLATFDLHPPNLMSGFASKYRIGFGTPFDLGDLVGHPLHASNLLDLEAINYVKITDVIGDGLTVDTYGNPIYDPIPIQGPAGFDLQAVGIMNENE